MYLFSVTTWVSHWLESVPGTSRRLGVIPETPLPARLWWRHFRSSVVERLSATCSNCFHGPTRHPIYRPQWMHLFHGAIKTKVTTKGKIQVRVYKLKWKRTNFINLMGEGLGRRRQTYSTGWLGGVVVRASDLWSRVRLEAVRCRVSTWMGDCQTAMTAFK